jgi:hypothetical protein
MPGDLWRQQHEGLHPKFADCVNSNDMIGNRLLAFMVDSQVKHSKQDNLK